MGDSNSKSNTSNVHVSEADENLPPVEGPKKNTPFERPTKKLPIGDVVRMLKNEVVLMEQWKTFFDELGLDKEQRIMLEHEFKQGYLIQDLLKRMLELWVSKNGNKAEVKRVIAALRKNRFNSAADILERNHSKYVLIP